MTASSLNSLLGAPPLAWQTTPDEVAECGLVRDAQAGCPEAFRALVERHQQRVYHFCYHYLRDAGDAREACQDTFIRAHHALGRYRRRARFSTWLFQIALNLCRDRLRRRRRETLAIDDHGPHLPCPRHTPDKVAMRDADLAKLDHGLANLPEKYRTIIVLSCLDGLSNDECAAILKCSGRAVEGRLYRARQRLAEWWKREG